MKKRNIEFVCVFSVMVLLIVLILYLSFVRGGSLDSIESSKSFEFDWEVGYNSVEGVGGMTVSSWVNELRIEGVIVEAISYWDETIGGWQTYDPELPFNDFDLEEEESYLVHVLSIEESLNFNFDECVSEQIIDSSVGCLCGNIPYFEGYCRGGKHYCS
ncbi:hypothetical protein ACFL0X_01540 [Nanoarchaeota archaeon]